MDASLLQLHWEKQDPILQKLYADTDVFFCSVRNLSSAFTLLDRSLRCIDEGTPGGFHAAGSGILLGKENAQELLGHLALDGVYSHAGCGAAALFAKNQGLDVAKADEYGKEWAQSLARTFNVPYKGHIDFGELARPSDCHVARVAYYDNTGTFDPRSVDILPPGFIINRAVLGQKYALQELEVALGIAFSAHCFGDMITKDTPFMVIAFQVSSKEIKQFEERYQHRVRVVEFWPMSVAVEK